MWSEEGEGEREQGERAVRKLMLAWRSQQKLPPKNFFVWWPLMRPIWRTTPGMALVCWGGVGVGVGVGGGGGW